MHRKSQQNMLQHIIKSSKISRNNQKKEDEVGIKSANKKQQFALSRCPLEAPREGHRVVLAQADDFILEADDQLENQADNFTN